MRELSDRVPKTAIHFPKSPINDPGLSLYHHPVPHPHTTHQAVPSELEEVEAVHAEADVLPVGGHGHDGLGVVPGHIMVDVP